MSSQNPARDIHILFGTQTGNAGRLAEIAARIAAETGWHPRVAGLDEIEPAQLPGLRRTLILCSSYGAGEMPANARGFWRALGEAEPAPLSGLQFAVMALGDRSYETFCRAGRSIDARLAELGANRVEPRHDCDLDGEHRGHRWLAQALARFRDDDGNRPAPVAVEALLGRVAAAPPRAGYHQRRPYHAPVLVNRRLSHPASEREVRHVELDLGDSGLAYEPGDGLGLYPLNDPALVDAIIAWLGAGRYAPVPGRSPELGTMLSAICEIVAPSPDLIAAVAARLPDGELAGLLAGSDRAALSAWLWGRDVLSLLSLLPKRSFGVAELVGMLRPLRHRSYSIASSPLVAGTAVHLTVATVRWEAAQRAVAGVCSGYLAERSPPGRTIGVFVAPNPAFRLPRDPRTPVIMVGPGTGIAPFRGFLQHRRALGANGPNWLFFGAQNRAGDYLYHEELEAMSQDGLLTRLDLAFSRDQPHKLYVQHLMRERGAAVFDWLEEGACLYVCGARRMATDVERALTEIVMRHRGCGEEDAAAHLRRLRAAERYLEDVY